MQVKEIKMFDVREPETDIIVSDGTYEILTCCYNADKNTAIGDVVKNVEAFLVENIVRINTNGFLVEKAEDYYEYRLQGKVRDVEKSIIEIGDLQISLDCPLPKDICVGEFIEFMVKRLDSYV